MAPLPHNVKELLEASLEYHEVWAITLCRPGTKQPAFKDWGERRFTAKEIKGFFRRYGALNPGVILGEASDLIDVDADTVAAEAEFAELADGIDMPVAPTFSSTRGKHRLFAPDKRLAALKKSVIKFNGLEFRIGANGKATQTLLPPSITDQMTRSWLIDHKECDPPRLPAEFVRRIIKRNTELYTEGTEEHKPCPALSVSSVSWATPQPADTIDMAIAATLPLMAGQRNASLFQLARILKANPEFARADVTRLRPIIEHWHSLALPSIATKGLSATWCDFRNAWPKVRFPAGQDPIMSILKEADARALPSITRIYPEPELKRLVALCRQLQLQNPKGPFFLDCRTAGRLLGVTHTTAHTWLRLLAMDKVLQVVRIGTRHKATEFRYLAD
jgi:hypothetical protein